MLLFGTNIQSAADELKKVQEEYLYNSLRNPKPTIAATIQQLRIVYSMDAKAYAQLKRRLPYFVCGQFNPPFRRKENFAYTESFILDFDHLSSKQLSMKTIRDNIVKDEQVMMCFTSPSEDGLKVMFRLKERCYDAGLYSIFYKAFAATFAMRHNLTQVTDSKTSDVARACFISIDPNAYFNPNSIPVDIKAYLDESNPDLLFKIKHEQDEHDKVIKKSDDEQVPLPKDPDKDILTRIRQQLNPKAQLPIEQHPAYVPERLNEIIAELKLFIEETGLQVTEIINIQYAKKIRARLGQKEAEVNLFYGKRGFSVVISPRFGTNEELNELLADLIKAFLQK
ncbi:virulence protein E [Prevotella scopos JCM 17725]|uniref:VirE N-terminal domain-containing protein n=1 Tax=Prevotella scopos JCM 17725 TaxID=1236518 RepID=A0AAX2F4W4_9BACT|nr:CRISPR-associated primase-polymerase type B [Prevotella scopos]ANR74033.1 virulence protein E [Prevotella scopos JCM 17725]QUB44628.1 virulence protein E [Prevotella scopos JCM 17725]SHF91469.1 VirE N-terminal domain-containing protein [Prevotella scopos JCM 17725]